MASFTTNKLSELAAGRNLRSRYLRDAQRAAVDNIYTVEHLIRVPLALAKEERLDFEDTFCEPMPQQLALGLEAEITMWERLQDGLTMLRAREVTELQLQKYTWKVRSYLAWHRDLLRLEEEMVTSCLVRHYEQQVRTIRATAWEYDLTSL